MAAVQSLSFSDWKGAKMTVSFLSEPASLTNKLLSRFQATVVTGRNGSHKSTLLRQLVAGLTGPEQHNSVQLFGDSQKTPHVVCMSGSVADRFPPKEIAGRSTEFDVPQYLYLGQRVGTNLLSKKQPIETLLTRMLDAKKSHRIDWPFFKKAHEFAGVQKNVEYEILVAKVAGIRHDIKPDILGQIQAIAGGVPSNKNGPLRNISEKTAVWLQGEFEYEDWGELESILSKKSRRIRVRVAHDGPTCDTFPLAAIRLGLLTDLLRFDKATLYSLASDAEFSADELSSGEYHMFTSLLGLGFGIEEGSVVLIDEPENSLHPQWQKEFMEAVIEICSQAAPNGHLIICTHSPLIVSAAPTECTIVNLSDDIITTATSPFGASTDEVLLTRFGVGSSRNHFVVDAVQRAVSYIERGDFQNPKFLEMAGDLRFIKNSLQKNDPLLTVIKALLDEENS